MQCRALSSALLRFLVGFLIWYKRNHSDYKFVDYVLCCAAAVLLALLPLLLLRCCHYCCCCVVATATIAAAAVAHLVQAELLTQVPSTHFSDVK